MLLNEHNACKRKNEWVGCVYCRERYCVPTLTNIYCEEYFCPQKGICI